MWLIAWWRYQGSCFIQHRFLRVFGSWHGIKIRAMVGEIGEVRFCLSMHARRDSWLIEHGEKCRTTTFKKYPMSTTLGAGKRVQGFFLTSLVFVKAYR